MQLTLTPGIGAKVWANFALDLLVVSGGIQLNGFIMQTKFPMTIELVFSKYPIDVGYVFILKQSMFLIYYVRCLTSSLNFVVKLNTIKAQQNMYASGLGTDFRTKMLAETNAVNASCCR